jgi:hypothetical protein
MGEAARGGGATFHSATAVLSARLPPGKGSCEKIQFRFPFGKEGQGGGRKPRCTNPLESPLTKGDTCEVAAKPISSQLQGVRDDRRALSLTVSF